MTYFVKPLAVAALMATTAVPALADGHMDLNSMNCADYAALSSEDQMKVATMALAELQNDSVVQDGEPKAVEATGESTTEAEATSSGSGVGTDTAVAGSDGEPKAVEATGGNTAESNMTAESQMEANLELFKASCDGNPDTMVLDAAVGMNTNR